MANLTRNEQEINSEIFSTLLMFHALSVTVIVHPEYVHTANTFNVIVLFPDIACVVVDLQTQLYVILHDSVELNV